MTDYEEAGSVTPEQYNKIEAIASSLRSLAAEKDAEIERLRVVLENCRMAVASLEPDALGIGNEDDPDPGATHWYIRDELLSVIDAALKGSSQ